VWGDLVLAARPLLLFVLAFKAVEAWVVVPAVGLVLAAALAGTGRVASSNQDLLAFALSAPGLAYAALFGTVAVAVLLAELAGVMAVAAWARAAGRRSAGAAARTAIGAVTRIARLGAVKLAALAATAVPFVGLVGLAYLALLSRHDINFYLAERPPAFWAAVGVAGLIAAVAAAVALTLYVRWAYALPILLFENLPARAALRESRDRVRGTFWRVAPVLVGWPAVGLAAGAALAAGYRLFAAGVLDRYGERPAVLAALLAGQAGLAAAVSSVVIVVQGLLTRRLYLRRRAELGLAAPVAPPADEPVPGRAAGWVAAGALLAVAPAVAWAGLAAAAADRPPVGVTAHRGHAAAAPENTLAAISKAIDSRADYAEIDVQLTADGAIILVHDTDFKRVGGDPRRPADLPLAEVKRLDVGRWFGPAFAGERVPTLGETIDLARGRIKLNIELKSSAPDPRLAGAVADLVRVKGFEAECLVTSFHLADLEEARRHDPDLRVGLIVAQAVGDVSRLDVDVLNVRADHLSDRVIRAAHRRGREVHVWTVNDPRQLLRLMTRGVDNVLTDSPDVAVGVRDEWAARSDAERLLGSARLLLGLDP
jgi:glycerophosphoryl diester phosphodiesterase